MACSKPRFLRLKMGMIFVVISCGHGESHRALHTAHTKHSLNDPVGVAPTYSLSKQSECELRTPSGLEGPQGLLLICSFTKAIKKRMPAIPSLWIVLEAAAALLRVEGNALLRVPGCLLCQRGCSSSLLLRNTGPQGLKWSLVITNRSLIGTDSMETSQSGTRCSCLNYSNPRSGALETANEGHAPEAKSPGHQLPTESSMPRRTSTSGPNLP